ncbi:substrate-binding periplasmic protein [Neisseriaceae bacterium B1]
MIRLGLKQTVFALACATFLAACGGEKAQSDAPVAAPQAKNGKVYRVVSEQVKPPLFTYVEGKPTGFEFDVLQAIAAKEGITFEYQKVATRADLLAAVEQQKADVATGAITINAERQQRVDFSAPVLDYSASVLVNKPLAEAKSFADLKGKVVASRKDTVYDQMALDNLAAPDGKNIRYYDTVWAQVKSLLNHETEVVLGDSLILDYYLQQNGSHEAAFVQGMNFPKESYGFALKKGDAELKKHIDDGLAAIRADGTYAKIYQKYWQQ